MKTSRSTKVALSAIFMLDWASKRGRHAEWRLKRFRPRYVSAVASIRLRLSTRLVNSADRPPWPYVRDRTPEENAARDKELDAYLKKNFPRPWHPIRGKRGRLVW